MEDEDSNLPSVQSSMEEMIHLNRDKFPSIEPLIKRVFSNEQERGGSTERAGKSGSIRCSSSGASASSMEGMLRRAEKDEEEGEGSEGSDEDGRKAEDLNRSASDGKLNNHNAMRSRKKKALSSSLKFTSMAAASQSTLTDSETGPILDRTCWQRSSSPLSSSVPPSQPEKDTQSSTSNSNVRGKVADNLLRSMARSEHFKELISAHMSTFMIFLFTWYFLDFLPGLRGSFTSSSTQVDWESFVRAEDRTLVLRVCYSFGALVLAGSFIKAMLPTNSSKRRKSKNNNNNTESGDGNEGVGAPPHILSNSHWLNWSFSVFCMSINWLIPLGEIYLFRCAHLNNPGSVRNVRHLPIHPGELFLAVIAYPVLFSIVKMPSHICKLIFAIQVLIPTLAIPLILGPSLLVFNELSGQGSLFQLDYLIICFFSLAYNGSVFIRSQASSFFRALFLEDHVILRNLNDNLSHRIMEEKKSQEMLKTFTAYLFHEVRVPLNAAVFGLDNLKQLLNEIYISSCGTTSLNNTNGTNVNSSNSTSPMGSNVVNYSYHSMMLEENWENVWETLQDLEISSNRAKVILNRVLDLNALENGLLKISVRQFELVETVKDVINMLKPMSANKNIQILLELAGTCFNISSSNNSNTTNGNGLPSPVIGKSNSGSVVKVPSSVQAKLFVIWDCSRYQELLSNFLSNALKYTPLNGKVRVRIEADIFGEEEPTIMPSPQGPVVTPPLLGKKGSPASNRTSQSIISPNGVNSPPVTNRNSPNNGPRRKCIIKTLVIDNGQGISKDDLGKLFIPFQQIAPPAVNGDHGKTQSKIASTGLGLTICKRIIDLSHGKVSVASELGKGSTFTFQLTLPCILGSALNLVKTTSNASSINNNNINNTANESPSNMPSPKLLVAGGVKAEQQQPPSSVIHSPIPNGRASPSANRHAQFSPVDHRKQPSSSSPSAPAPTPQSTSTQKFSNSTSGSNIILDHGATGTVNSNTSSSVSLVRGRYRGINTTSSDINIVESPAARVYSHGEEMQVDDDEDKRRLLSTLYNFHLRDALRDPEIRNSSASSNGLNNIVQNSSSATTGGSDGRRRIPLVQRAHTVVSINHPFQKQHSLLDQQRTMLRKSRSPANSSDGGMMSSNGTLEQANDLEQNNSNNPKLLQPKNNSSFPPPDDGVMGGEGQSVVPSIMLSPTVTAITSKSNSNSSISGSNMTINSTVNNNNVTNTVNTNSTNMPSTHVVNSSSNLALPNPEEIIIAPPVMTSPTVSSHFARSILERRKSSNNNIMNMGMGMGGGKERTTGPSSLIRGSSSFISLSVLANVTVLIVDDDQITGRMMAFNMKRWGCQCLQATNGKEALDLLLQNLDNESFCIDVILLDKNMPELDGFETVKAIRSGLYPEYYFEHEDQQQQVEEEGAGNAPEKINLNDEAQVNRRRERWEGIKVIGVTGGILDEQQEFLEAGADKVMTKPVRPDDLRTTILGLVQDVETTVWSSDDK